MIKACARTRCPKFAKDKLLSAVGPSATESILSSSTVCLEDTREECSKISDTDQPPPSRYSALLFLGSMSEKYIGVKVQEKYKFKFIPAGIISFWVPAAFVVGVLLREEEWECSRRKRNSAFNPTRLLQYCLPIHNDLSRCGLSTSESYKPPICTL
ncbi:hypothetical protein DFH09DRAFT_1091807 [Mycena vulgaris]|nr:hypothetical protein DFH09DRAFT_1091807 [Mycena vulgaris]